MQTDRLELWLGLGPYINYAVEKKHRTRHMFGSIRSAVVQARMCWYDLVQDSIGILAAARRSSHSPVGHSGPSVNDGRVLSLENLPGNLWDLRSIGPVRSILTSSG